MKFGAMVVLMLTAGMASAQVAVDVSAYGVKVQTGGGSNAGNDAQSGSLGPDVEMEGVAVINGEVFIDGEKVPKGKTSYTSRKSGKTYLIRRSKGGNVSVSEK
ncbi:hypothetical protein B9N43_13625 [Denitratisoma sp. DHT3]|uniref:hypothetical protein n=1 Tax=Denitratisoma sp. DHT3 TaxID=1981880 RepID=UPI001198677C|nr:hypothetical protein [Denitratisoma sp. DHT3]QDX82193.1 hypothetical protein B9N43_13625 [Denitratisoma sp. DHT3]